MNHILAYIDPGTGSMLFTIIIGIVTTGVFVVRGLLIKFKFTLQGGKAKDFNKNKLPLVIFSDDKRYWNIFKPICDELESREQVCTYMTASPDDPALSEKYKHIKCEFIGEGNKAFARLNMMSAKVCLSTTPGLDVLQWKRSKDVDKYVHIFHAVDDSTIYRMFGLDYYDVVLLNDELQGEKIRKIEGLRNINKKEMFIVGTVLLDSLKEKYDKLITSSSQIQKETKTILCAPSWGASSILNRYGESFIQSLIDTGYKIIIRPHPQSKTAEAEMLENLQNKFPNGEKFEWNFDTDNFNVLNEADILISDFSGVIFDYTLIFDKPIIYADTSFDKNPYDAAWLEETPWSLEVLPSLGAKLEEKDFPRMKEIIDSTINSDVYKKGRDAARKVAWAYEGEAAKRTVDYLIDLVNEKEAK